MGVWKRNVTRERVETQAVYTRDDGTFSLEPEWKPLDLNDPLCAFSLHTGWGPHPLDVHEMENRPTDSEYYREAGFVDDFHEDPDDYLTGIEYAAKYERVHVKRWCAVAVCSLRELRHKEWRRLAANRRWWITRKFARVDDIPF